MISSDVHALLEGPNIAHVATLAGDGARTPSPCGSAWRATGSRSSHRRSRKKHAIWAGIHCVAISITDRDQPTAMASIRGRVIDVIRNEPAWEIIDRVSNKYIGQPYPRDEERIVFIIEVDHAFAHTFG